MEDGDRSRLLPEAGTGGKYFSIADDDDSDPEFEREKVHPVHGHQNPFETQIKEEFQIYPPENETELIRTYDIPVDMRLYTFLAAIFCFFPTGIVALNYAFKARTDYLSGNRFAASKKTEKARLWCKATLVIGILILSVAFLTLIFVFSLDSG